MLRYHSANMPNGASLDWNDLRCFLAVARGGSTLAAGRALRVSQTTIARRIAALEEAVKLTLFEKRQAGYALTPEGVELLSHAEAVESAAQGFESAASASTRDLSGNVRVTTEEIFAVTLLAPMLRELRELHPNIRIELDTSQAVRDLPSWISPDPSRRFTKRRCSAFRTRCRTARRRRTCRRRRVSDSAVSSRSPKCGVATSSSFQGLRS